MCKDIYLENKKRDCEKNKGDKNEVLGYVQKLKKKNQCCRDNSFPHLTCVCFKMDMLAVKLMYNSGNSYVPL